MVIPFTIPQSRRDDIIIEYNIPFTVLESRRDDMIIEYNIPYKVPQFRRDDMIIEYYNLIHSCTIPSGLNMNRKMKYYTYSNPERV